MANLAKKGSKSTGLAKGGQWADEMRKHAQDTSSKEQAPGGSFISFRGGVIKVAGTAIKGNELKVLILDAVYENVLYLGDFDPDSPKNPACYAFGEEEKELVPGEQIEKPFTVLLPDDEGEFSMQEIEPDGCKDCPANKWGTAQKRDGTQGKGKACKNIRRLAVISANQLNETSIAKGEVFYIKVPVTSCKSWSQYVKALNAEFSLPYFGVVTTVHLDPDEENQIAVSFRDAAPIDESLFEAILKRREAQLEATRFPYPKFDPEKDGYAKPKAKGEAKNKPRGKGKF